MPRRPVNAAHRFEARARAFWDARQKAASNAGFSGYLLDESPPGIGQRRFAGEWADFQSLLPAAQAHAHCLDLGCGTGLWTQALARQFAQVEAWDYAPAMARAARLRLRQAGLRNARVHSGRIETRPGRAVFDLIFVGGVLMYCPEASLPRLLRALRRLLKPGGTLILRESCSRDHGWVREGLALRPGLLAQTTAPETDYVAIYRSAPAVRSALQTAGFEVRRERSNRHYKFSDLTEDWLRRLNRLSGGRLTRHAAASEKAAAWIYAWRWILLYPEYALRRWRLNNRWFVCKNNQRRSST
mgnify:CR=1 FL=1